MRPHPRDNPPTGGRRQKATSFPLQLFSPSPRGRHQHPPPRAPPPATGAGGGRYSHNSSTATGGTTPGGGGGGGRRGAASRRPRTRGGGQGELSWPPINRRHVAAGKRPVQAGSPGVSTPSKPNRGRGIAGAGMAGRAPMQQHRHMGAARGLFALGRCPGMGNRGGRKIPQDVQALRARGTEAPAASTPEPLARVLLSRRVH